MNKPNGLFLIPPENAENFVETLLVEKFHGIGQVTAVKMHSLGVQVGADLKQWSLEDLMQQFGKVGRFYYKISRAQDDRPVEPNRRCKSIGVEVSFIEDLSDHSSSLKALEEIAQALKQRLDSKQTCGRTLTLKVKYADYQQITRSRTLICPIGEFEAISGLAKELLATTDVGCKKVRLLGLALSNLDGEEPKEYVQLTLGF